MWYKEIDTSKNSFVFVGTDIKLMNIFIKRIAKNKKLVYITDPKEIKPSILDNIFYILINDKVNGFYNNTIQITEEVPNKYKNHENVVYFNNIPEADLLAYINKLKPMSEQKAKKLIKISNYNLSQLHNNLLNMYHGDLDTPIVNKEISIYDSVKHLCKTGKYSNNIFEVPQLFLNIVANSNIDKNIIVRASELDREIKQGKIPSDLAIKEIITRIRRAYV